MVRLGLVGRSRPEDLTEVPRAEWLDEVGVRAPCRGGPFRGRVLVEGADDDAQGREVVSEGTDRVQSLRDGELNLKNDNVGVQAADRVHRADRPVRVANHTHIVTGLLDDVTQKLTTIEAIINYHNSHVGFAL